MSQQRDSQVRDARTSSQLSREDDEICSNKATSGLSDQGSDDLGLPHTPSRSSERGLQRPMTRGFVQYLQTARTNQLDTADATPGVSSLGSSSLIGLTLDPLPPAMLPSRKRSLGEVLGDESPPQKDKMAVEIDQLAGGGLPHDLSAESHRQKKSKPSGELSTSRVLPITTGDSATSSDGHGNRSGERHSERIRDASRRGNPAASD